ncbi:MAG: metal ABC transporter permease, partial [Pseudomonadota bacterium]|nr:metal ABC transporter permease [Pseudomonadota bacterium]
MSDALSLLLLPFAAAVAFVLVHAYFGVHVLKRRIVFADLALAQLSGLGATVAFANGYEPTSLPAFAYALAFTGIGAALLTVTRSVSRHVSQEAFVGILYVVATAATVLAIDRSPQGAEHVKRILVGNIAIIGAEDLIKLVGVYLAIAVLHWFIRRPMLALSAAEDGVPRTGFAVWAWDFVFYASFGVVVTSSVAIAGVLLVFSLL